MLNILASKRASVTIYVFLGLLYALLFGQATSLVMAKINERLQVKITEITSAKRLIDRPVICLSGYLSESRDRGTLRFFTFSYNDLKALDSVVYSYLVANYRVSEVWSELRVSNDRCSSNDYLDLQLVSVPAIPITPQQEFFSSLNISEGKTSLLFGRQPLSLGDRGLKLLIVEPSPSNGGIDARIIRDWGSLAENRHFWLLLYPIALGIDALTFPIQFLLFGAYTLVLSS